MERNCSKTSASRRTSGEQVEVEVLCGRRHAEGGPHLLGVGVVGVADVGLHQSTVEGRPRRQLRLLQSCGSVKVIVWEDPLLQRGRRKLEAVDEEQPAERERDVFRHVVGYDVDATGVATECWGDELGVVSPQVV